MEKVRMTLRLVKPLNEYLKKISKETGRSRNDLIIAACWNFIEQTHKKERSEQYGKHSGHQSQNRL